MKRYAWLIGCIAAAVVGCGSPAQPTRVPPTVGPATPPVIISVTASAARTEVEQDVVVTAVVEDAETPLNQLTYLWSANVGTITGNGLTATWRHPGGLTSGRDVVVTLTVVDRYQAVAGNFVEFREFRVVGQAAPFRVHDSTTELKELARKFLIDLFGNSSIAPSDCLVDFSEVGRCAAGKSAELDDITNNRRDVVIRSAVIHTQRVVFAGLLEARVVSFAEFHDTIVATGLPGMALGDFVLTAIYDSNRWWLCESTFEPLAGYGGLFNYYKNRGDARVKK